MGNLGWIFYKKYFKEIERLEDYKDMKDLSKKVEKYINNVIDELLNVNPLLDNNEMLGNKHFEATTTYPGLLLGSGNMHELANVEGQLILGFHFDYTSGLPTIQGSSIKGVLKSAFKHPEYIQELLDDRFNKKDIEDIEKEIFENKDIFFEAVIIEKGTKLLEDDYLAPHKDELTEPIPLRFLKVAPNVTFRFDFELYDGILSKDEKLKLFENILKDLGLGAKTNVGYGKFENFSPIKTKEEEYQEGVDKLEEMIKQQDISGLESFKANLPEKTEYINQKIEEIKQYKDKLKIEKAFDNLDKSNQKHIKGFKKKYENNPLAKECIEELRKIQKELENKQKEKLEFDITKYNKIVPLSNFLKKFPVNSFTDKQKLEIETYLLNIQDKVRKFPFTTFKGIFGKDKTEEIVEQLKEKGVVKQLNT